MLAAFGCAKHGSAGRADAAGDDPARGGATSASGASAPGGAGGALAPDSLEELLAPLPGEHEILGPGCGAEPIGQEFRAAPTLECSWFLARTDEGDVRNCTVHDPPCTGPDDCTSPFGFCRGSPYATCEYPVEEGQPCTTDADCADLPHGTCNTSAEEGVTYCYPDGRCELQVPSCFVDSEPCATDDDCRAAPGGTCVKRIDFPECAYHECLADADCPVGHRCACSPYDDVNVCVPAACASDADCGDGQTCRLEHGCQDELVAFHCSTPADTCQSDADCAEFCLPDGGPCANEAMDGVSCAVVTDSWECVIRACPR